MTGPDGRPYLRLFGQLPGHTVHRLQPDFSRRATTALLHVDPASSSPTGTAAATKT